MPQSTTILTEKLLEDRHTDTVREALHYTAGITFQAAEGGEEDIRLRGFSLTASGDIYIDNVRDPAFYDRDVFNFDRIELLRGSASMLFGRGSTGGVVNQVSKQPVLANINEVSLTAGSGGYFRTTGDFNIQTSETSALRLNVMTTSADIGGNEIDKYGFAPSFRFKLGSATIPSRSTTREPQRVKTTASRGCAAMRADRSRRPTRRLVRSIRGSTTAPERHNAG